MNAPLTILYRDHDFIAVDKPVGMIVHRAGGDDDQPALLQTLRDQIGERVFPIHRLDQPTSGIVLFGLDPTAAAAMVEQFTHHRVRKYYQAVTAGWTPPEGRVDKPLWDNEASGGTRTERAACTLFETIRWFDVPILSAERREQPGKVPSIEAELRKPPGEPSTNFHDYPAARAARLDDESPPESSRLKLSWIEASPQSGRWHQIRRHLSSIGHPILGDYRHGREEINAWLEAEGRTDAMMLSSVYLAFEHPFLGHEVVIRGPRHAAFDRVLSDFLEHAVTMHRFNKPEALADPKKA